MAEFQPLIEVEMLQQPSTHHLAAALELPSKRLASVKPEDNVPKFKTVKDNCLFYITPTLGDIKLAFKGHRKSAEFYFWNQLYHRLENFFKGAPETAEILKSLEAKADSDPNLVNALPNLIDALKAARDIWHNRVHSRFVRDKRIIPKTVVLETEARIHASFYHVLDCVKGKKTMRPFKLTRWQYSEKMVREGKRPPADKVPEASTSFPLIGREEDLCFWPRFFGPFSDSEPIERFCDALYFHIRAVEQQTFEVSIELFKKIVETTTGKSKGAKISLQEFMNYMQRFGPRLCDLFDHLTGVVDKAGNFSPWITYTLSQDVIEKMIGQPKPKPEEEKSEEADEGDANEGDVGDFEEENVDKLNFMIRMAKEKNRWVLQYDNDGKVSNSYIDLGEQGYFMYQGGKEETVKTTARYPTVRKFLLDYGCERMGFNSDREALLKEHKVWLDEELEDDKETIQEHLEEVADAAQGIGLFFGYSVNSFFEERAGFGSIEEAIDSLVAIPPHEDDETEHLTEEVQCIKKFEETIEKCWTATPYWGFREPEPKITPAAIEALEAAKFCLEEMRSVTRLYKTLGKYLTAVLTNKHFRTLWVALWELPATSDDVKKILELLTALAKTSNKTVNFNLPMTKDERRRPDISSFWLRIAAGGLANKFYAHNRVWEDQIVDICQAFGALVYSDPGAVCLAVEYPLVGILIQHLEKRLDDTWSLPDVASVTKGVRQLLDFLAVDDHKRFRIEGEDDKEFNRKFRSDKSLRQRGVALLMNSDFLRRACIILLNTWTTLVGSWQRFRELSAGKSVMISRGDLRNPQDVVAQTDFIPTNFEGVIWGDKNPDNSLVKLTKEVSSLFRLVLYSKYRSLLFLQEQDWVIQFTANLIKLPIFEVKFEAKENNNPTLDKQSLEYREMLSYAYSVADNVARLKFPVPSHFETLMASIRQRTWELYDKHEYKNRMVGTEVAREDGHITLYHFELEYAPWLLDNSNVQEMKENFIYQLDPDARGKSRQESLVEPLSDTAEMYVHQYALSKKNALIRFIADHDQWWSAATTLLIAIINIIIAPSAEMRPNHEGVYIFPGPRAWILILGFLHSVCSFLMISAYFCDHYEYNLSRLQKRASEWSLPFYGEISCFRLRSAMTWAFAYQIGYFVMSIFGLIFPWVFCYSLVICVLSTDMGQNLLVAFKTAFRSLVVAFLMGMALVYAFATAAFFVPAINGQYQFADGATNWEVFLGCIMGHMHLGMRGAPVWEEAEKLNGRSQFAMLQFVWSFIYNFFIIMVLVAIIGGVVVDAFGQIRDQRDSQREAASRKCLICGATREDLDEKFDRHIVVRHPVRSYLNLLIYTLFTMDDDVDTADDSFDHFPILHMMHRQVMEGKGDYFPSWQMHQTQINDDLLDVGLEREHDAMPAEFEQALLWDVPICPVDPHSKKRSRIKFTPRQSVHKRIEKVVEELASLLPSVQNL